jgi:acetyltransferase-like isoleucine patch superfamily enzyme
MMKTLNVNTAKKTIRKVRVGKNVKIYDFVNLYECSLGDQTQVGAFVEIQKGAKIGNRCRIQSHTFICEGVTIEDEVFVGHGVVFINDKKPSVRKTLDKTWTLEPILIKAGATIGSGAILMAGVTVGKGAFIGAGAVVINDVADRETVVGVPARSLRS